MLKPKDQQTMQIARNGWTFTIIVHVIHVMYGGKSWTYRLPQPHSLLNSDEDDEYVYIHCPDFYYQFKMEEQGRLVVDKFDNDGELIEEIVCWVPEEN